MTRRHIPQGVLDAAHARSAARAARDWDEADRLRADIEAAGWTIVDRGTDFALSPTTAADVVEGERVRFGSSGAVPARFDEPPIGLATVVLVATDRPDDLGRSLKGLLATSPPGTTVVIVADGPSDTQAVALDTLPSDASVEIVWTLDRLGVAAAANIGIRRSRGPVVILLDDGLEPTGDVVTPLVDALADLDVAIAGGWGSASEDLRRFAEAPPGDVDAIDPGCVAFRRADAIARGPLDEGFRSPASLATWWSLVLRDEGEDAPPRRALRLERLPVSGEPGASAAPVGGGPATDRAVRRDRYRIIDRFGWRRDLLTRR